MQSPVEVQTPPIGRRSCPAAPLAGRASASLLIALLLSLAASSSSLARGLAYVFYLGTTKSGALVFLPTEGDTRPFVWKRGDASATPLDLPKSERLLNLKASTGTILLATTAEGSESGLVRLSTLGPGQQLVAAGTVQAHGRPTSAASAVDDTGVSWVFVETYREEMPEVTAYRRSGEAWVDVATAKTELGVPRQTGTAEMSVLSWTFQANPPRATTQVPRSVSARTGSLNLVERFRGCAELPLSLDREGATIYQGEVSLPPACLASERAEDAVGLRFPVVRCTDGTSLRVQRFTCEGWREVASGTKPYFPATPEARADNVGQVVDLGNEVLLLGNLLIDGERKVFSLASVREGHVSMYRIHVP